MANQELKLCQLQVTVGTGAWRTVMDFPVTTADYVMGQAEQLFLWFWLFLLVLVVLVVLAPPIMSFDFHQICSFV